MRVVAISDTHLVHRKWEIEVPAGDLLIHAGDATNAGTPKEVAAFNEWFSALPHEYKIFVAGNHDILFDKNPILARGLLDQSISYLEDSEIVINGVRIYGSPWTPVFRDWAFSLERGEALAAKWRLVPKGTSILVTHCPPFGILDQFKARERIGCIDLARAVEKIRPKFHVFGHVHAGYGTHKDEHRNITYINVALCDESRQLANDPIEFLI